MHCTGDIELVVKHFGAEQLVFGMGPRCHNGAAIASLIRADISEKERNLIASGNVEKLLAPSKAKKTCSAVRLNPITSGKSELWKTFLQGKKLEVDIVDAHMHIGPSAGYVVENQTEDDQIQLALKTMDRIGIKKAIVSGFQALLGDAVKGNDLINQKLAPHSDRLVAYVGFNPFFDKELIARFPEYFSGKVFVGFKTLCSYWDVPITDIRFKPMWEYAEEHCMPVLSHSWGGPLDEPKLFKDLAKNYPNVAFLIAHSAGTNKGRMDLEELVPHYPNIYMEWCGSFCSNILWEETLKKAPAEQIVFGTDAMAHNIYWELGRLLSLDVSDDAAIIKILGKNMQKILSKRK
jgi:predicted TIM-barrel fold metal-dependent hydrolase